MNFNHTILTSLISLGAIGAVSAAALPTISPASVPSQSGKPNINSSVSMKAAVARLANRESAKNNSVTYGPYWVELAPGYCNIAKVYLQGSQIFGTEVGCSDTLNQTYAGTVDFQSDSVYLTAPGLGTSVAGIWTVDLVNVTTSLSVTTLDSNNNLLPSSQGPYAANIYLSQPAGAAY